MTKLRNSQLEHLNSRLEDVKLSLKRVTYCLDAVNLRNKPLSDECLHLIKTQQPSHEDQNIPIGYNQNSPKLPPDNVLNNLIV